jgi:Disulphide bond corrector protein DsbC
MSGFTTPTFRPTHAVLAVLTAAAFLVPAGPATSQKPDVRARFVLPTAAAAGTKTTVLVEMTLGPKWHVNSHTPAENFLIPTDLTLKASAGKLSPIRYPKHVEKKFAFSDKPLLVYEGTVRFETDLDLAASANGMVSLSGTLGYQACNEEQCFTPEKVPVEAKLAVR